MLTVVMPYRLSAKTVSDGTEVLLHHCIRLDATGRVFIRVYKQEMGQGVATGVAMIAAEEMDADWNNVEIEMVDFDKEVPGIADEYGRFDTGGSFSIEAEWDPMRRAGATVRELLRRAAAKHWNIPVDQIVTDAGEVINNRNGERLGYGKLAAAASQQEIPEVNVFKDPSRYRIVGKPLPSKKTTKVSDGSLVYSIDAKIPGMVYAAIARPPVTGGKLKSYNDDEARVVLGVSDVFALAPIEQEEMFSKGIRGGVVVVADSTWACLHAKELLKIEWEDGPNANRSSQGLFDELDAVRGEESSIRYAAGDVDAGFAESRQIVEAAYESPYLGHGLMEPLNATAHYKDNGDIEIWAGTQSPQYTSTHLSRLLGIDKARFSLHPYPMGGGYGRRYFTDFILESVMVSKQLGRPVKLVWSREDEIRFGAYHPLRKDFFRAGLDEDGNIHALELNAMTTHEWGGGEVPFHWGYKHLRTTSRFYDRKLLQWGSWRSVVSHHDTFSRELFIDELAHAAGKNPMDYRLSQLKTLQTPENQPDSYWANALKNIGVVRRILPKLYVSLRELSGWDRPRESGVGLGVAAVIYHERSFCAQVAEVEVKAGKVRVRKVYCVADCGLAVNPNLVKGQLESAILWGLNPVLHGGVTAENGRVMQSNYDDMPLVTMNESPDIVIRLHNFEDRGPQGVGEFGVPPVAPAVLNAVFAATGKRIRTLNIQADALA